MLYLLIDPEIIPPSFSKIQNDIPTLIRDGELKQVSRIALDSNLLVGKYLHSILENRVEEALEVLTSPDLQEFSSSYFQLAQVVCLLMLDQPLRARELLWQIDLEPAFHGLRDSVYRLVENNFVSSEPDSETTGLRKTKIQRLTDRYVNILNKNQVTELSEADVESLGQPVEPSSVVEKEYARVLQLSCAARLPDKKWKQYLPMFDEFCDGRLLNGNVHHDSQNYSTLMAQWGFLGAIVGERRLQGLVPCDPSTISAVKKLKDSWQHMLGSYFEQSPSGWRLKLLELLAEFPAIRLDKELEATILANLEKSLLRAHGPTSSLFIKSKLVQIRQLAMYDLEEAISEFESLPIAQLSNQVCKQSISTLTLGADLYNKHERTPRNKAEQFRWQAYTLSKQVFGPESDEHLDSIYPLIECQVFRYSDRWFKLHDEAQRIERGRVTSNVVGRIVHLIDYLFEVAEFEESLSLLREWVEKIQGETAETFSQRGVVNLMIGQLRCTKIFATKLAWEDPVIQRFSEYSIRYAQELADESETLEYQGDPIFSPSTNPDDFSHPADKYLAEAATQMEQTSTALESLQGTSPESVWNLCQLLISQLDDKNGYQRLRNQYFNCVFPFSALDSPYFRPIWEIPDPAIELYYELCQCWFHEIRRVLPVLTEDRIEYYFIWLKEWQTLLLDALSRCKSPTQESIGKVLESNIAYVQLVHAFTKFNGFDTDNSKSESRQHFLRSSHNLDSALLTQNLDQEKHSVLHAKKVSANQDYLLELTSTETDVGQKFQLNEWSRAIPPDSLVINFVEFEKLEYVRDSEFLERVETEFVLPIKFGQRNLAAFLYYSKSNKTNFVQLGAAEEIESLVEQLLSLDRTRSMFFLPQFESPIIARTQKVEQQLYQRVWERLGIHLDNIERIIISAEGCLNQLSFMRLRDQNNIPLLEKSPVISYLTDLSRLTNQTPKSSSNSAVTMGVTEFGQSTNFHSLPRVQEELSLVDSLWQDSDIESVSPILNPENAESVAKVVNSSMPRFFHIASHGFTGTRGELCDHQTDYLHDEQVSFVHLGKDIEQASDSTNRCVITSTDIKDWNLQNTEVVSLAVCGGSRGKLHSALGVRGLKEAFIAAGATSFLSALAVVPRRCRPANDEGILSACFRWCFGTLRCLGSGKRTATKSAEQ